MGKSNPKPVLAVSPFPKESSRFHRDKLWIPSSRKAGPSGLSVLPSYLFGAVAPALERSEGMEKLKIHNYLTSDEIIEMGRKAIFNEIYELT